MTEAGVNGHAPKKRPAPPKLPHNLDAEQSILGGIILRNEVLGLLDDLEPADFFDARNRVVFTAMRNLVAGDKPIDVVTLENEIEHEGRLDAVGGVVYLGEITLRVPTPDNVAAYADIVKTHRRNRDALVALGSALERAKTWPHDPAELVAETMGELGRLVDQARDTEKSRLKWCTPIEGFLGDEEPNDDDAEDWIVRDLVPRGEAVLWGGPMKGGKTWAALDLSIAIARGESWLGFENTLGPTRALGLFLEDSKRRIRKRVWELCRGRVTEHGFMSPNDRLLRENLRISRTPIRIPDPKDVRRFIAEIKAWGARFVVIDNLTRIFVGDPNSTRDAAAFTRAWAEICDETGAALMLLHHTKKVMAGDRGGGNEIDPFETLRGSGDFGAAARNIIVVSPIRQDNGPALAELRMRGNLDLRREGFIMGFERDQMLGKWRAKLVDKGEIGTVKQDLKKQRAERKESEKRETAAIEARRRRDRAIELARAGGVSQGKLADALGLASARTVSGLLNSLVQDGILRADRSRGYVLADEPIPAPESTQETLL